MAPLPVTGESVKAIPSKEEAKKPMTPVAIEPMQEERTKAIPPSPEAKKVVSPVAIEPLQEDRTQAIPTPVEIRKGEPIPAGEPMKEERTSVPPPSPSTKTEGKKEVKPAEEKRIAAATSSPTSSKEKEKVKKAIPPEIKEAKLVDKSQPIDITSDKVEAYWKENLIVFKGNVIARQKDIVIYADSVEAVIIEDGKGIEKVIAGGNVKIQQGLRVANCQKAVFYNVEQKVVMTGDPKVSEGDNIVSGDEIIFDIGKNRVDVRGGPSGRGKAKIQPGGEFEKLK